MGKDAADFSSDGGADRLDTETLVREALRVRDNAYAPYSQFPVGAAILGANGELYGGCNVENASFGVTICAEQAAVARAVSSGETSFTAVAVVADSPGTCTPCGKCRQLLSEFGLDLVVVCANTAGAREVTRLSALLPGAFERGQLPAKGAPNPQAESGAGGRVG